MIIQVYYGMEDPRKPGPGRTGLMTSSEDLMCAVVLLQLKGVSLLNSSHSFCGFRTPTTFTKLKKHDFFLDELISASWSS